MKLTYDLTVDAAYAQLRPGSAARTVEIDSGTLADLDEHDQLVGIELLTVDRPWPVHEIGRRFEISDQDAKVLSAVSPPTLSVA